MICSERYVTELALPLAELQQLPDPSGDPRFTRHPVWRKIRLDFDYPGLQNRLDDAPAVPARRRELPERFLNRSKRAQAITEWTDGRGLPLLNIGDITGPPGEVQG